MRIGREMSPDNEIRRVEGNQGGKIGNLGRKKKPFTKSGMKLKSGLGLCMKNLDEEKKRKRQQDGEPQRSPQEG